ncbi:MAG: tRNA pseudouridine(55) synthase TruB [Ignavibacteriaceae bacterium]
MITNDTIDYSKFDFDLGETILIDKPFWWTSFHVVHNLRKAVGVKKVGHAGTLDPMATGLLIVCTGKKTKEITTFQELEKTYTGIITLGKTTTSMDLETEIIEEKPFNNINEEMIFKAKEEFTGQILQIPPMYSAVKYKGKALYKYARKGKTVEREPREVFISKFNITNIELPDIHFEISCSKGTYIRVIANDLGISLGCGALLSSLRRTKIGNYNVENALLVDDFIEKIGLTIV